jgi:DNA-binding SARP family transcriptional activator
MEYRILGPLEVVEDGRALEVGAAKQRALLAVLLLHANEVVPTDRLLDALWEDDPPARATKTLQVYVSQLRKTLGSERITTRDPGYLLLVEENELDLQRFQRLAGAGRLEEALGLWRGEPLAEFAYQRFARAEIARLEELRLVCLERRIDEDLVGSRHADVVGELEALVARHPLRESLRRQLMLALYRSGRQAEALATYQDCRRLLGEELGLDPSDPLKELERAVLRHDPALELSSARADATAESSMSEPSVLVVARSLERLAALLALAEPLVGSEPPRELIVAHIARADELHAATETLRLRREDLAKRDISARTAAFSSPSPAEDIVRLASQQDASLLILDAGPEPLDGTARGVLAGTPCDVALLVEGESPQEGPVIVPFGAAEHDWAALELGAWIARATEAPLRLIGAASDKQEDARDASRLLADASLIVQRTAGVFAEPLLAAPGREGVLALAQGAGLLVVGLSERWSHEGLGRVRSEIAASPPAPTVFVRGGPRPGGLAPAEARTRFTWSLTSTPDG